MKPAAGSHGLKFARNELLALSGIALGALVARLIWLRFDTVITPDGFFYARLAEGLAAGDLDRGLSAYWPPLYPMLVAPLSLIFRDVELAGRTISMIVGSLIVFPQFLLVRKIWDRRTAYVGAVLVAVHPAVIDSSTKLLSDMTYTMLLLCGVLAGMFALFEGRRVLYFWSGAAIGACYLTRPEGFAYVFLLAALAPLVDYAHRSLNLKKVTIQLVLLGLGFASLSAPYLLYLRQETGGWTISAKFGTHLLRGHENWYRLVEGEHLTYADKIYAGLKPAEARTEAEPASPSRRPRRSPATTLLEIGHRLFRAYITIIPEVFPPLVILIIGLGLFNRRGGSEQSLKEMYLVCFILATLVGYASTVFVKRYLVPQVPLVYAWVAAGIVELERRFRTGGEATRTAAPDSRSA